MRRGKNRAAGALRLAAWSLMRSKSYLGACEPGGTAPPRAAISDSKVYV